MPFSYPSHFHFIINFLYVFPHLPAVCGSLSTVAQFSLLPRATASAISGIPTNRTGGFAVRCPNPNLCLRLPIMINFMSPCILKPYRSWTRWGGALSSCREIFKYVAGDNGSMDVTPFLIWDEITDLIVLLVAISLLLASKKVA